MKSTLPGVTGQYPRPEYTRVYYGLGQFIFRGIIWPRPIHTTSGHNILRGINWPRHGGINTCMPWGINTCMPRFLPVSVLGFCIWGVLTPGTCIIRAASNLSRLNAD